MTDLHQRFDAIHRAARSNPPPGPDERRQLLATLKRMVLVHRDEIADAISRDFGGRSRAESELLEIVPTLNGIRHASKSLHRWMRDERRPVDIALQPARSWVRYEPLGVIGIISPWNYPLFLALSPLTDALAAGNRVMLKPSELTPNISQLLAKLVAGYFEPDLVTVVNGDAKVGKAFSALPFDHLLFTGSTAVGREVMRTAAANLTPVTLELGGKSPAIVADDYPVEKAASSISFGKFVNAGQTCVAPDYLLAPVKKAEQLARAVLDAATRAYPAIQSNEDYSNIIDERHRDRLNAAIEEARAGGATVLSHADMAGPNGKIAPTVVLNAPPDCLLMREEIFGPVLPVLPYVSIGEAVDVVNQRDRPLALYLFTNDRRVRDQVLDGAISGGVTINGTLLHVAQDGLPFGGIGPSGMGAYHGREGFRRFSHARAVHKVGFINIFEKLGPPWSKLAGTIGNILAKR